MQTFIRQLSTTRYAFGLSSKTKVTSAVKNDNILIDKKHYDETLKKKQKKFNETAVKNSSANKLLEDLLGRKFDEKETISSQTLFTAKELNTIFNQKNIRLTYRVLGTSGRQIQDSLLVDNDVQKFLERDDLLRAKQLAKIARHQGMFAYGTILQYLLKRGQVNDAFDIFMDLKKRGYQPKGRFYNILISGYADAVSKMNKKAEISQQKIEQLYRAFQKDHLGNNPEISIYHVNSMLKVLRKGKRVDLALALFDSLKEGRPGKLRLRPDVRTYTEVLRILSSAKPEQDGLDFVDIINRAETIFYNAQHNIHVKVDAFLVRAYASLYVYCDDLKLRARAVTILREWFRLSTLDEIKTQIDYTVYNQQIWDQVSQKNGIKKLDPHVQPRLLPFETINVHKSKRFEPDEATLRMYSELCSLFNVPFVFQQTKNQDLK